MPDRHSRPLAAAILVFNGVDMLVRPFHAGAAPRLKIAPAIAGGLGIGALGGAIGVILGTMRMPVLLRGVGMTAARAVGTNLVVGFAVGAVGLAAHAARLEVEWWLRAIDHAWQAAVLEVRGCRCSSSGARPHALAVGARLLPFSGGWR